MRKAIVITLGVIIGVTGVLAICAHLADAARLALYAPEDEDDEERICNRARRCRAGGLVIQRCCRLLNDRTHGPCILQDAHTVTPVRMS